MLGIYRFIMGRSAPLLRNILTRRCLRGKEDPARLNERTGEPSRPRPDGALVWFHAASVGEAQSALILVNAILKANPALNILVTTGTRTSARMMQKNLPERAFHQFIPLDHPDWVRNFINHWHPNLALWMESELWPNILLELQERKIPTALINARLSEKSFRRWRLFRGSAGKILNTFSTILCQTSADSLHFKELGAPHTVVTDNLKYSAAPLPAGDDDLTLLSGQIMNRPVWLYASTHKGEEELACRVHQILKSTIPELLTIIVPRHPERRNEIRHNCSPYNLNMVFRGDEKIPPVHDTDIYVADTMGELGLFYRIAPIACIGRCFSEDGGGGHNPIEAAQLGCGVLYGPNVQYQQALYDEMSNKEAALPVANEMELTNTVRTLLSDPKALKALQTQGLSFIRTKEKVLEHIMDELSPLLARP